MPSREGERGRREEEEGSALPELRRDALLQALAEPGGEVERLSVAHQAQHVARTVENGAAVIAALEMGFQARPQFLGHVLLKVIRDLPQNIPAADFERGFGHPVLNSPKVAISAGGHANPV